MSQAASVVCPACSAAIKVTKPSLIGKSVACPSCKKPFRIQLPATDSQRTDKDKKPLPDRRAAEARQLDDDIPLLDDSRPLVDARAPVHDDWIPLADSEPTSGAPRRPDQSEQRTASQPTAAQKTSSTIPVVSKEGSSKKGSGRPKSGTFASQTQKNEFEAMLADTDGQDDELDFGSLNLSGSAYKSGSKFSGSTLAETDEFSSLLDTDEHPTPPAPRRVAKAARKPKDRPRERDSDSETGTFELRTSEASEQKDAARADAPVRPRRRRKKHFRVRRSQVIVAIAVVGAVCAAYFFNQATAVSPAKRPTPHKAATAPAGSNATSTAAQSEAK